MLVSPTLPCYPEAKSSMLSKASVAAPLSPPIQRHMFEEVMKTNPVDLRILYLLCFRYSQSIRRTATSGSRLFWPPNALSDHHPQFRSAITGNSVCWLTMLDANQPFDSTIPSAVFGPHLHEPLDVEMHLPCESTGRLQADEAGGSFLPAHCIWV
jgi:hypothetical protein